MEMCLECPRRGTRPCGDPLIAELVAWATANLHEDLSLDRLARRGYLSRRSLSRRFLAATGETPYAWVLRQRVRLAGDLLADPRTTVETVAHRVGFSTGMALRQHFRRAMGCTPTQFRARLRHSG
jgi:transcriptional regulator GlxA family with amidase domain